MTKKLGDYRISILGLGNMGEALLRGLISSGKVSPGQFIISEIRPERRRDIRRRYQIKDCFAESRLAAKAGNILVIAVKPQQVAGLSEEVKRAVRPGQVIFSIVAAVPLSFYERVFPGVAVVRAMPNTPALCREGVTALCAGHHAKPAHLALAGEFFQAVGKTVIIEERLFPEVTAISGSGPAYLFYLAEQLLVVSREFGFSEDTANILVQNTLGGAVRLWKESKESPGALRARVTSPGGTTAAALEVFQNRNLPAIVHEALVSSRDRSREITKEVGV